MSEWLSQGCAGGLGSLLWFEVMLLQGEWVSCVERGRNSLLSLHWSTDPLIKWKTEERSNHSFWGWERSFSLIVLWVFECNVKVVGSRDYFRMVPKGSHTKMRFDLCHWKWLCDIYVLEQQKSEGSRHRLGTAYIAPSPGTKHSGDWVLLITAGRQAGDSWLGAWALESCCLR